jgi:hypothetical protein
MARKKDYVRTDRVTIYEQAPLKGQRYGKTTKAFQAFRGKQGVYKIFEGRKLVYIGSSSSDIYKTILRKFQVWNDRQTRLYYNARRHTYKAEVLAMPKATPTEILDTEYHLIQKAKPRDNKPENYSFYNRRDLYEPEKIEQKIEKADIVKEKELENFDYSQIPF